MIAALVRWSRPARSHHGTTCALLALALVTAMTAAISFGAYPISVSDVWFSADESVSSAVAAARHVLFELRLPRVLLATLIGASLALAGLSLQTLFHNPLADPGLIGVASGAALGAVLCLVLQPHIAALVPTLLRPFLVPIAAFLGGLLVAGATVGVVLRGEHGTAQMLLFGIAVNAFAGALIGCVLFTAEDQTLRDFVFWNLGSLAGAAWSLTLPVTIAALIGTAILVRELPSLDAFALGERAAGHLGVDTARARTRIVIASALLVGAAVAAAGVIGFIGLVVPHLARGLVGATHRRALPAAAMLGAILLVSADLIGRTVVLPAELPIGIVTALGGTPFLVWLIHRDRRVTIPR